MNAIAKVEAPAMDLALYDEMCRAIGACYRVDEVKDIRDKARAMAVYFQQAKNVEAERRACEIRLRAERRGGRLLATTEKAKGGRPVDNPSPDTRGFDGKATLADHGITYDQSANWQKLAAIPEEEFEAALAGPAKPTTAGILASATPPPPKPVNAVPDDALWLWGRLMEIEERGLLDLDPNTLVADMLPLMREDARNLAPRVAAWLERIAP